MNRLPECPETGQNKFDAVRLLREDETRLLHQMVRDFSTREPFGQSLRKQLNLIGLYLRVYLRAYAAYHYFSNPKINRVHWFRIGRDEMDIARDYRASEINVSEDESRSAGAIIPGSELRKIVESSEEYSAADTFRIMPFCQHDIPFGNYILAFHGPGPTDSVLRTAAASLNVLQSRLKDLLYNHYPITAFTYLPSFQTQQTTEAAILFCDIRNSTAMFEITRLARDERQTELLITLIKGLFEYASTLISVSDIGRIHRFMGDGFLATFGEYLTVDTHRRARAACALALLSSRLLVEGFAEMWQLTRNHPVNQEFLRTHNEDVELRLGTGIDYGQVWFDLFGHAADAGRGGAPRGFYEYTAVGDHMNFAQRLCSVASQPRSTLDVLYRSEKLPTGRLTAPIVGSRTVVYSLKDKLSGNDHACDPLVDLRTDLEHRGKGFPMPAFEISPSSINSFNLLGCLESIHDNRYRSALAAEIVDVKDRPALKAVLAGVHKKLDALERKAGSGGY
jgi:class 3 adenylate cyclase